MKPIMKVELGPNVFDPSETIRLPIYPFSQILVAAIPRQGKGGIAKPLAVDVSKVKRLGVFDFRGEWGAHITQPNPESPRPACVAPYRIYKDFTFKLTDFLSANDWVSLGFRGFDAALMARLCAKTRWYHEGNPKKFLEVMRDLPTKEWGDWTLEHFNRKYKTDESATFNWTNKQEWMHRMEIVMEWFWQGESDVRPIYDFALEWVRETHIIIDFAATVDARGRPLSGLQEFGDNRCMAFCGRILKRFRQFGYYKLQGFLVFEETDALVPRWTSGQIRPSSNDELIYYVAKAPKDGMGLMCLVQNPEQIDQKLFKGGRWAYIFGLLDGEDFGLRYDEESGYREFLVRDVGKRPLKFVPRVPVCLYESNVRREPVVLRG